MYEEWGGAPAAGVVTVIGSVAGRRVMVVANDATVKAGACFPMTIKKILRAQTIAAQNRLPLVYLVDSSGVFLPMQDEVFPDEDDFGRIFRNNAVLSARGIPQFAAIMGNCVAGGAYLPVLCDTVLMTEGSGLYLAGPALVKAAIGQEISHDELGGARVHAAISGTVDYREPDDDACLARLRRLIALLPPDPSRRSLAGRRSSRRAVPATISTTWSAPIRRRSTTCATCSRRSSTAAGSTSTAPSTAGRWSAASAISAGSRWGSWRASGCGSGPREAGPIQFGGVIYADSADKAARFVLECNQSAVPILFIQDVNGFDVGRDAERTGIIRRGAKLVSAVSNSTVPKITLIVGHSFGAGHYALCGKAFDPRFLFAWPGARYAVMGAQQAARTMLDVNVAALKRRQERDRRRRAGGDGRRAASSGTIARPTSATPPRGSGSTRSSTRRRRARCWRWRSTSRCGSASSSRSRRACFRCELMPVDSSYKSRQRSTVEIQASVTPGPQPRSRSLRVGNGAGFWGDNLDAPYLLARDGQLDVLTLEYLAELTMAILSHLRSKDKTAGYVTDFPELLERLAPILNEQERLRVVTNAGGLNPPSCAARCGEILEAAGMAETADRRGHRRRRARSRARMDRAGHRPLSPGNRRADLDRARTGWSRPTSTSGRGRSPRRSPAVRASC